MIAMDHKGNLMGHAAQLFNGNAEQSLIGRITPTTDQREFLQVQWNNLADYLKTYLYERTGYPISTWLQGSYKYGTLIKPTHPNEEYDVDVGIYFEWDENEAISPTPEQLREWVQEGLVSYEEVNSDVANVEKPPKERCSRVTYKRQFHIDTPVYHLKSDKDMRRLACLSGKWEISDPKAIYKWFKESINDAGREQLRRVIRYLKAWAAISFKDAPGSRPSSILLTVLATEAYQTLWLRRLWAEMEDDDVLTFIIHIIHGRLFENKKVPNPIDLNEDLNRLNESDWEGFLPRLQALQDISQRAKEAEDEVSAALAWSEAFSFLIPLPETDELEIVDEVTGRAVMQLPEIDVEVYSRNPKQLIQTLRNEVPSVARDCDLKFKIANPYIVPDYAIVEWTVRNEGEEADLHSDLGHRRIGMRMLSSDEHTSYAGRHFMDCIIRLNGQVYSARRVPVTVRSLPYAPRNQARPAYTKLRSSLRRRK